MLSSLDPGYSWPIQPVLSEQLRPSVHTHTLSYSALASYTQQLRRTCSSWKQDGRPLKSYCMQFYKILK